MIDLQLSERETRLMASALDERLRELQTELVHTDDRALKRDLVQMHTELEQLARRVHQSLESTAARAS